MKRLVLVVLVMTVAITSTIPVFADTVSGYTKVVALGADLTQEQKDQMLSFFNVNTDEVEIIEINNQDERQYLAGIASEQQLGTHTYSCVYIEPTNSGGINVMTANLNWATGDMIRNALITSGITDCNVIAAAPIQVSGSGALTGIFKAYENSNSLNLDSDKIEAASLELITTTTLANETGTDTANEIVTDLKQKVIEEQPKDDDMIADIVDIYLDARGIELSAENRDKLIKLLKKITSIKYDAEKIRHAYDTASNTVSDANAKMEEINKNTDGILSKLSKLVESIKSFFDKITGKEIADDNNVESGLYQDSSENIKNIFNGINLDALGENIPVTGTDNKKIKIDIKVTTNEESTEEATEEVSENTSVLDSITFDMQNKEK